MNNMLFSRLRMYCEAISVSRQMKETGLITEEEFHFVEEWLAQRYGFSERSILREMT